ncbi:TPA: DUF1642 domain-containing protein [Enterococcus faecium]|uniref:DUF1642 domain-containing protein n=1 Tax=Enterococcus faecium TaxID=1352 RepID=UPI001124960D|nr:DUF1642 domain-containing protein [Enterococcus faecium]TNX49276.1 DUF1642 domain-containing protein [Enterococcus faecium]HAQ2179895.1 DUF1642 domain-containing protein [Enterococcus faecium]
MNKKVLIDKQALIDELMKIPGVGSNSDALETIKRFPLYEPQKPVVPKFVAEWIEKLRKQIVPYHFESGARFMMFIGRDFHHKKGLILINEEIRQWLEKDGNEVILSNAIDYGYEVEKEPLYEVIIGDLYLIKKFNDRNDFCFDTSRSLCTWEKSAYQLTEAEIKAIDERFWAFAVPVEEVVEG